MKAWRRSEPRVARPFFAVAALEKALDETILLVGEREREIEDDVVQLDPADFDDLRVAICPRLDEGPLREDVARSQSTLEATLGESVAMFSYPYGTKYLDFLTADQ